MASGPSFPESENAEGKSTIQRIALAVSHAKFSGSQFQISDQTTFEERLHTREIEIETASAPQFKALAARHGVQQESKCQPYQN